MSLCPSDKMLTRDNFPTTSSAPSRVSVQQKIECLTRHMCSVLKLHTPPPQSFRVTYCGLTALTPTFLLSHQDISYLPPPKALHPLKLPIILRMHHLSTSLVSSGPREELAPSYWFPWDLHHHHLMKSTAVPPPHLTDVNLQESGKGRLLPAPPTASGLQMEHGLTSLELKHMGRDTIAGLIAGILQKYTKKEDVSV